MRSSSFIWVGLALLFLVKAAPAKTLPSKLSIAQLRELARNAGFPEPNVAAAVAYAESGGNTGAIGDGGHSFGLWQIHLPAHPQYKGTNLLDPLTNARAAILISKSGTDFKPWTTFRNGAYLKYL